MGTRHLICVFYNGRFVIAQFGWWDGYPEGQGLNLLKFLRVPTKIQRLKDGLEHIYEASRAEIMTAKTQINRLRGLEKEIWEDYAANPMSKFTSDLMDRYHPSLHGDTGAAILEIVSRAKAEKKVPIAFDLDFANDGLYCEFAYVVNLDTEILEVFHGAKKKTPNHRFRDVGEKNESVPIFTSSFTFSELQRIKSEKQFLTQVNKDIVSVLILV